MPSETLVDLLRSLPGGTGAFGSGGLPRLPHYDDPKLLAAENLVAKAVRRLHDGDEGRARQAVERVVGLGWFELEESPYGVFSARVVLFDEMTDALEGDDLDDWAWRDACLAMLNDADDIEAQVLRDPLAAIVNDYDLPKRETRELRRAIGDADGNSSFGLDVGSSAEEVGAVVWAMVSLTSRLHDRLNH